MIPYVTHLITFILSSYAICLAVSNLISCGRISGARVIKVMIAATSSLQIIAIVSFLYNQSIWLVGDYEEVVGSYVSMSWLAYDYLNSLFHIATASTMRLYLQYRYKSL